MSLSATPPAGLRLSFVVRNGKFQGQKYNIFAGMVIGRGEQATLYLPDFKASRAHAKVAGREAGFELSDLESHNGTFLNGDRISQCPLREGDVVHIGSTRLEVVTDELPRAPTAKKTSPHVDQGQPYPPIFQQKTLLTPVTLDELAPEAYFTAIGIPSLGDFGDAGSDMVRRVLTKTRNFAIVYEISKALGRTQHVEELLRKALDYVLRVMDAGRGHILELDQKTGVARLGVSRGRGAAGDYEDTPAVTSQSIIDCVVRERAAVITTDAREDIRFPDKQSIVLYNLRSVLCAPMMHGDRVVGIIQLDTIGAKEFNESDLELIAVIAPVLAVALENTRLIEAQEVTIAELREAHEKLVRAQERLVEREKMAVVGKLTAGLAHELKNLMGPFLLADLLAVEYPEDENIQEYSSAMLEAHQRIQALVEEIRLLSRGEKRDLRLRRQDLGDTISSVVRFLKCDREVREHGLTVTLADNLPALFYDEERIKQVLFNLIRNAAQAMTAPGELEIWAAMDSERPDTVRLEVRDEGPGIPPELRAQIFEPFFTTNQAQGTGLGLDISRQIVERHGGQIFVAEPANADLTINGTVMVVRLPLAGPPRSSDDPLR